MSYTTSVVHCLSDGGNTLTQSIKSCTAGQDPLCYHWSRMKLQSSILVDDLLYISGQSFNEWEELSPVCRCVGGVGSSQILSVWSLVGVIYHCCYKNENHTVLLHQITSSTDQEIHYVFIDDIVWRFLTEEFLMSMSIAIFVAMM